MSRLRSFIGAAVICLFPLANSEAVANPPAFTAYSGIAFTVAQSRGDPIIVLVGNAESCTICEQQFVTLTEVLSLPDFQAVQTFQVDFDRDDKFLKAFRVSGPSTIIMFRDGKEVGLVSGMTDRGALCGLLAKGLLAT